MTVSLRERDGLAPVYACDAWSIPHGFSTRMGGVSTGIFRSMNLAPNRGDAPELVAENFRRFCAACGCKRETMVITRQVHGTKIHAVEQCCGDALELGAPCDCDGLMTDVAGVTLVVFSADCIPILLHDPVRGAVAAVHAGWRGTAARIAAHAVERMAQTYGCAPKHIRAAIGPGISACCFETDADVPQAMLWAQNCCTPLTAGRFSVDLKAANALALRQAGVAAEHIAVSDACTMCQSDLLWSHRKTKGERGCLAAAIALPEV